MNREELVLAAERPMRGVFCAMCCHECDPRTMGTCFYCEYRSRRCHPTPLCAKCLFKCGECNDTYCERHARRWFYASTPEEKLTAGVCNICAVRCWRCGKHALRQRCTAHRIALCRPCAVSSEAEGMLPCQSQTCTFKPTSKFPMHRFCAYCAPLTVERDHGPIVWDE